MLSQKKKFTIALMGGIGAGKTTLSEKLAKLLNAKLLKEPVIDNIYLEKFYEDMKKNSFLFQITLLDQRFKQQQQMIWDDSAEIIIQGYFLLLLFKLKKNYSNDNLIHKQFLIFITKKNIFTKNLLFKKIII
eukprot:EC823338.1.p1 GENE.EC823338.1~~EC823338.1.p1  ORF type:complete len:142 (+),score=39.44 EC823338.1:32-427(+)